LRGKFTNEYGAIGVDSFTGCKWLRNETFLFMRRSYYHRPWSK